LLRRHQSKEAARDPTYALVAKRRSALTTTFRFVFVLFFRRKKRKRTAREDYNKHVENLGNENDARSSNFLSSKLSVEQQQNSQDEDERVESEKCPRQTGGFFQRERHVVLFNSCLLFVCLERREYCCWSCSVDGLLVGCFDCCE